MPESAGIDVPAMEDVGICVGNSEYQDKSSESRQQIRVPCRPRYPRRLLSSASKDGGENEQHGPSKCKRGVSPTNSVTRLQRKQKHQCAGHYQCKKRVIPKAARLGKRNHRAKYSLCAQEREAGDVCCCKIAISLMDSDVSEISDLLSNEFPRLFLSRVPYTINPIGLTPPWRPSRTTGPMELKRHNNCAEPANAAPAPQLPYNASDITAQRSYGPGGYEVARPAKLLQISLAVILTASTLAEQKPFPVVSTVDEPSIAGRPVRLDAQGKLLPWPMPDNTGYSYSSHVLSQWTILWDQYNRQRLPYFHCCFDFDRTTYELIRPVSGLPVPGRSGKPRLAQAIAPHPPRAWTKHAMHQTVLARDYQPSRRRSRRPARGAYPCAG